MGRVLHLNRRRELANYKIRLWITLLICKCAIFSLWNVSRVLFSSLHLRAPISQMKRSYTGAWVNGQARFPAGSPSLSCNMFIPFYSFSVPCHESSLETLAPRASGSRWCLLAPLALDWSGESLISPKEHPDYGFIIKAISTSYFTRSRRCRPDLRCVRNNVCVAPAMTSRELSYVQLARWPPL